MKSMNALVLAGNSFIAAKYKEITPRSVYHYGSTLALHRGWMAGYP
jgi:hypothetical protein